MPKIFAYMRISTTKATQKIDRQKEALTQYAKDNHFTVDKWIADTITGSSKVENRSEYARLKEWINMGDTLLICDIDRLGRNADDVIMELKDLKRQGIRVVALDVPHMNEWDKVNNSSIYEMIIDIVITLKAHMAQQEKEKIVSRINQGLAATIAKGTKLGRPTVDVPKEFIKEYLKYKNGDYGNITTIQFAKLMGLARSTVYKYANLYNDRKHVTSRGY